jgi:hypothetical protein
MTNPIRNQLALIANHTISADKIPKVRHYVVFLIYSWANEVIAALAGIGIAFPVVSGNSSKFTPQAATYLIGQPALQPIATTTSAASTVTANQVFFFFGLFLGTCECGPPES